MVAPYYSAVVGVGRLRQVLGPGETVCKSRLVSGPTWNGVLHVSNRKGLLKISKLECDNVMTNANWLAGHRGREMIKSMNTEQRRHAQAAPTKVI